jgi:hypothetical protein
MARIAAPPRSSGRVALRALLAGSLVLGAIGSCELPKPKLPSIGTTGGAAGAVAGSGTAASAAASAAPDVLRRS